MSLRTYLKELDKLGINYDVSFTLSDSNNLDPGFFFNSWLSDGAYNKLFPMYSIEDPDAVVVEDIAAIKHVKQLPEWLLDIPEYGFKELKHNRCEYGVNLLDIEIYTNRVMHLYLQNKQNTEVL